MLLRDGTLHAPQPPRPPMPPRPPPKPPPANFAMPPRPLSAALLQVQRAFPQNSRVELHQLVRQPELNGSFGVVIGYTPPTDACVLARVNIRLDIGKSFALKADCLRL
eukprot:7390353-Prymnesium_polylepis.1